MTDKQALSIAAAVAITFMAWATLRLLRHYRRPRMATISKRDANLQRFKREWLHWRDN